MTSRLAYAAQFKNIINNLTIMVKHMKSVFVTLLTLGLFYSSFAQAGGGVGKVGLVYVNNSSKVFFDVGVHNNPPSCQSTNTAANTPLEFAIDLNTTHGEGMYALLMLAKGLDKNVQVVGSNDCSVWPDRESVQYLLLTE